MGIYELSIKRPFTDFKKLGIGLLFNILPILNFFAVGYALRCAQLSMKNNFEMPPWDKKDELFKNGLFSFLISFIYGIPFILFLLILFFKIIIKFNFTEIQNKEYIIQFFKDAIISNLTGFILISLLFILIIYVTPSATMNFISKNKFSKAFEFSTVFKKAFTGKYFITILLMFLYSFILYLILSFIPFIGGIISTFLIYVSSYSAYGAVYNKL